MVKNTIKKKIDSADIISFDMYETLFSRVFSKPTDVFQYIEKYMNTDNIDFVNVRKQSERKCIERYGNGIYSFDDIYNEFDLIIKNKDIALKFKQIEENIEINSVIINKDVFEMLAYAHSKQKTIILVSDMYFSTKTLNKILTKLKVNNVDRIYVSNEYKASKHSGILFKIVKQDYKNKKILHIGDSYRGDYIMPKIKGIKSLHYDKFKLEKKSFEYDILRKMTYIFQKNEKNEYMVLGYSVLGPLLYSFCNWIYNQTEQGKKKIFFLAREGLLIKECYEYLFPYTKNNNSYLCVSRKSVVCLKLSAIKTGKDLLEVVPINKEISEQRYYYNLGVSYGDSNKNITNDAVINTPNDIIAKIRCIALENKKLLVKYLSELDFKNDVYICDIGWKGTMQNSLSLIQNIQIKGLYLAVIQNDDFKIGYSDYTYFRPFVHLVENMFIGQHGTTLGYKLTNDSIKPIFAKYEFCDRKFYDIQQGAKMFLHDIKNIFDLSLIIKNEIALENILRLGLKPKLKEIKLFANTEYLETKKYNLINKNHCLFYYIFHPKQCFHDFKNSGWKIGFLKQCFKISFPYYKVYKKLTKRR